MMAIRKLTVLFLCMAALLSLTACPHSGNAQTGSQSSDSQPVSSFPDSSAPAISSESPDSGTVSPGVPVIQNVSGAAKAKTAGSAIPYENIFAGFVSEYGKDGDESTDLPVGDVLLGTEKEWNAFFQKYLQYDSNVNYSRIPGNNHDFNFKKNSILYHSALSAKEDVYSYAYPIDKIVLGGDHKPALQEKEDFGSGFQVTANASRYIILVSLKKTDLAH